MRTETKRAYEKRIAELEDRLETANDRANQNARKARMWEGDYHQLRNARRLGEEARQWAVEQAIYAGQTNNIVRTAAQIVEFVYGPDTTPDSDAENPS